MTLFKQALFLINVVVVTSIVVFLAVAFVHHQTSPSIAKTNPVSPDSAKQEFSSEMTSSSLGSLMIKQPKLFEPKQTSEDKAVESAVTVSGNNEKADPDSAKIEGEVEVANLVSKNTEQPSLKELLSDNANNLTIKKELDKLEREESIAETNKKGESQSPKHVFEIGLPTENTQLFDDPRAFYMHTNRYVDGVNTRPWTAGQYGYVRNQRWTKIGVIHTRLHEGIDIKPVRRDGKDEPLDDVVSISEGTVVYVNSNPYGSSYGRYVVVKHEWPEGPFYSLYAHLANVVVSKGVEVKKGHVLGRLGYSGVGLNRERAHVHVELAFMLSDRFNSNYSPNQHGDCNGLNLLGLDIGRFLIERNKYPELTLKGFLATEEPYFTVRTKLAKQPGILKRHPWLGVNMGKAEEAKCWDITFTQSGVPLSFTPCFEAQTYPIVTWVKEVGTNHSYLTSGRLLGSGKEARLSSKGYRFIGLLCEDF